MPKTKNYVLKIFDEDVLSQKVIIPTSRSGFETHLVYLNILDMIHYSAAISAMAKKYNAEHESIPEEIEGENGDVEALAKQMEDLQHKLDEMQSKLSKQKDSENNNESSTNNNASTNKNADLTKPKAKTGNYARDTIFEERLTQALFIYTYL